MQDMLKHLNLTAEQFLNVVWQFITILLGKDGPQWWEDFKKFLRRELMTFHHDDTFNMGLCSGMYAPRIISYATEMGPGQIETNLVRRELRMGTPTELIAYVGFVKRDVSVMILTTYGPRNIPCAVVFTRKGSVVQFRIIHNQETAIWHSGCEFLVFDTTSAREKFERTRQ